MMGVCMLCGWMTVDMLRADRVKAREGRELDGF